MSEKPIDDVVAELEALEAKASVGEWTALDMSESGHRATFYARIWFGDDAHRCDLDHPRASADAALIAAMRNALPRLLAERRELLARIAADSDADYARSGFTTEPTDGR